MNYEFNYFVYILLQYDLNKLTNIAQLQILKGPHNCSQEVTKGGGGIKSCTPDQDN